MSDVEVTLYLSQVHLLVPHLAPNHAHSLHLNHHMEEVNQPFQNKNHHTSQNLTHLLLNRSRIAQSLIQCTPNHQSHLNLLMEVALHLSQVHLLVFHLAALEISSLCDTK